MLAIRFQRRGRKNDPSFRIIVSEKTKSPKAGNPLEILGSYDPITKDAVIQADRVKHWISQGAELSGTVNNLLVPMGIIVGKKINVVRKRSMPKTEEEAKTGAPATPASDSSVSEPKESNTSTDASTEPTPTPEATASAEEKPGA